MPKYYYLVLGISRGEDLNKIKQDIISLKERLEEEFRSLLGVEH
jgi:hypothetical protein